MFEKEVLSLPHFYYEGKRIVVDTGALNSQGSIGKLEILGDVFYPGKWESKVKMNMPDEVYALVGLDIINNFDFKIEPNSNEVIFSKDYFGELENSIEIDDSLNLSRLKSRDS